MTDYQKRRARIWMLLVRDKGSDHAWSPTGADWHNSYRQAAREKAVAEETWPFLEYKVASYLPEMK